MTRREQKKRTVACGSGCAAHLVEGTAPGASVDEVRVAQQVFEAVATLGEDMG